MAVKKYKDFACFEIIHEEIEHKINEKLLALDSNDSTFEARKYSINKTERKILACSNL